MSKTFIKVSWVGLLFLLIYASSLFAGWTRTYGGDGVDEGGQIIKCSDGNFVIIGSTTSFGAGGGDIWLLKINPDGDTLWTRTYGGDSTDSPVCIEETSDSGFIIACNTESFGAGGADMWLVKTDSNGDTLWTHTYGNILDDIVRYAGEAAGPNSGFMIIGNMAMQFPCTWLLRVDSLGNTINSPMYLGECVDACRYGDYFAAMIFRNSEYSIILLHPDGWVINSSHYESDKGEYYIVYIGQFASGQEGCIVSGCAYSGDPLDYPYIWISEAEPFGGNDIKWCTIHDYGYNARDVSTTSDSGYIALATSILKLDKNMDLMWAKPYGNELSDVVQAPDGGYLFVGSKENDLWLLKTGPDGDTLGISEPATPSPSSPVTPVTPVTHLDCAIGREIVLRYTDHPQGFHASIYDASGRRIDEIHSPQTQGTLQWGAGHGPGVYFIVPDESKANPAKVVLIK